MESNMAKVESVMLKDKHYIVQSIRYLGDIPNESTK